MSVESARRVGACFAIFMLGLISPAAVAETPAAPLSLRDVLDRAIATHPALTSYRYELTAREAEARTLGQRPGAHAELVVEDVAGTGARSGADTAQTTLSFSQVFEMGGKRDARVEGARARLSQAQVERQAGELDLLAEVTRRFITALSLQERISAQSQAVELARQVQGAVEERVKAAASPEAERSRAVVATAEADLALEDAQHQSATARQALIASIGALELPFSTLDGDLFETGTRPEFAELERQLAATPDAELFVIEERLRAAELRQAQAQASPDVRASIGLRQFQDTDDTAFVGGIEIPLFSRVRAQGSISAATARRDRVASDRAAALLRLRTQLFGAHQEMEHARHVLVTLRETIIPQLTTALDQTEFAWRRGRYSYLEWSEAQRRLLEARVRAIDAATEYHLQKIELERLTGQSRGVPGARS